MRVRCLFGVQRFLQRLTCNDSCVQLIAFKVDAKLFLFVVCNTFFVFRSSWDCCGCNRCLNNICILFLVVFSPFFALQRFEKPLEKPFVPNIQAISEAGIITRKSCRSKQTRCKERSKIALMNNNKIRRQIFGNTADFFVGDHNKEFHIRCIAF